MIPRPDFLGRAGRHAHSGAPWVLGSVIAMQTGQALAKAGLGTAGPLTMTALRFGFGAMLLWVIWRPRPRTDRRTLLVALAMGTCLAGVNVFLYTSLAFLPLGLAVAVQFTGPLAVSLGGARRARHGLWAVLSAGGVVLISGKPGGAGSPVGVLLALASAGCFAGYILLGAHLGRRGSGGGELAMAATWAALITFPFGLAGQLRVLAQPSVLGIGFGAAVLCTAVANSWELRALRHLPARVFAVLVSLEPVVAALAGLAVLGERLTPIQWLALAAIVLASVGATVDQPTRPGGNSGPAPAEDLGHRAGHGDPDIRAGPERGSRCP